MKTIIFSCSEREDNLSIKASKAVQKFFDGSEIIDLSKHHLHIFGTQDDETYKNFCRNFELIKNKFAEAQQVVFISPEYNWGLSPNAKNLIDHLSGNSDIWSRKVFMCFGCSSGRGGRLPIIELWKTLNKIIALSNSISVVSPYHVEITANLLTEQNDFIDEFKDIANAVFENHLKLVGSINF